MNKVTQKMTPAKLPPTQWSAHTDTALAALHGGTRQNWSAYRKAHSLPASPAGHGGRRHEKNTILVTPEKAPILRALSKLPASLLRRFARAQGV